MATMTIYASSVSGTGWTNPSYASGESDSSYASVTLARNTTRTLTASFTNSLPDGATVNSITAYCRLYRSNTTTLSTSTLGDTTVTIPTSVGNISYSAGTTFPSSVALSVRTSQRNNLPTIYVDSFWLEIDYTVESFYYPVTYNRNITKTDLSADSVILESTTGEYSAIYFQIKDVPYGSSKKIDFDYETNVSAFRLRVIDTVPDPDVNLFVEEYADSTSGHVTLTFTNNGGGEKNLVTFSYNTSDIGTFTITNFTVTEAEPARLFPYEIEYALGSITETDTTINGATLTTDTTDESLIYYTIPCPYEKKATIDFDYTTDIGSFYLGVVDRVPSPDVHLTDNINQRDTTSGHITLTFTNNGGGNVDYVSFYYETWRVGYITLSNFTVTEAEPARLFPYEIDPVHTTSDVSEVSTTVDGFTLVTPAATSEAASMFYIIPAEYGKKYTLSFDYSTDLGSFYYRIYCKNVGDAVSLQNIRDTYSGTISHTFTFNDPTAGYFYFGWQTYRAGTFTATNFTVTVTGTNLIRLGDITPKAFFIGANEVDKICIGDVIIYEI